MRFEQALRLAGLMPREIVADGRWRRCATESKPRKRNGAYKLAVGGGRGWFRDWQIDDSLQVWDDDRERQIRAVDLEQMRRSRERERVERINAMRGAREFWGQCRPMTRLHPYLSGKQLVAQGCAGLRTHGGLLVVPVWHGDWIISVQKIAEDGTKRFWPGAPIKAGCYVIDRPGAALTAVCEGLATGLAIFQSVRHARVIVAFDAGNLLSVVQRLKPSGSVVICADNDHATEQRIGVNTGLHKAREAADLIGCDVAYPEGIDGTDFADALIEWSSEDRKPYRAIERIVTQRARYVGASP